MVELSIIHSTYGLSTKALT